MVQLFVGIGKMFLEVLGHAETLYLLLPKDRLHGLVGGEPLLHLWVLEVLLLQIGHSFLMT